MWRNVVKTAGYSRALAVALGLFLASVSARAEVRLELMFEHEAVLQFEPVFAYVAILNDSDIPFDLSSEGSDRPDIRFVVEKRRDEPLSVVGKKPLIAALRVMPAESKRFVVDLAQGYDLVGEGPYKVRVEAVWRGRLYASNTRTIDVVPGIEMVSVSKALMGHEDRTRTYSLRYWPRGRSEYLFLRVDDKENAVNYGVFQLGSLVRFGAPRIEIDRLGNVTVVHQATSDCFARSTLKCFRDRVEFVGQTFHLGNGNPYPYVGPR